MPLQIDLLTLFPRMLDGFLAGVIVQPRLVPIDEWLPAVFDAERRALPEGTDAAWLARTRTLIERRFQAINAAISEDGFFDPVPDVWPISLKVASTPSTVSVGSPAGDGNDLSAA